MWKLCILFTEYKITIQKKLIKMNDIAYNCGQQVITYFDETAISIFTYTPIEFTETHRIFKEITHLIEFKRNHCSFYFLIH